LKCGRNTEKIENVSGPHLRKCPHCGGKVESVITAPAIQFKGAGWYVTDYGGKKTSPPRKQKKPGAKRRMLGRRKQQRRKRLRANRKKRSPRRESKPSEDADG